MKIMISCSPSFLTLSCGNFTDKSVCVSKSCAAAETHPPALYSWWKQASNVFLVWASMCCVWVEGWDVWLECWKGTEWQVWTLVGRRGRGTCRLWHHRHPKARPGPAACCRGGVSFLLSWPGLSVAWPTLPPTSKLHSSSVLRAFGFVCSLCSLFL